MTLQQELLIDLFLQVGQLLVDEGEKWRLEHPELVDVYSAIVEEYNKITEERK